MALWPLFESGQGSSINGATANKLNNEKGIGMNSHLNSALTNFKRCADGAPEGCYEVAKLLNHVVGDTCDQLIKDVRALGLNANNCDLIFAVEAAIYDYVKRSNPDNTLFSVAEGFGVSMDGPARERVIAQTENERDFLRGHQTP